MMTRVAFVLLACAFTLVARPAAQPADSEEAKRVRESVTIFGEIMRADDQSIPRAILSRAEGIAVFPNTVKAGFVFGGMRGRGVLSAKQDSQWSSPTFMTLTGGSFGLQIGAQAADIILVVMQRRGLESLVRNQFKFGADASVAAGPVGRDAQASTDLQMRAEILSYSRARGLFAGVTINGSTVRADVDANERFYGKRLTGAQIVLEGQADRRSPVPDWTDVLDKSARP